MELKEISEMHDKLFGGGVFGHYFCALYTPPDFGTFTKWLQEAFGRKEGLFIEPIPNKEGQAMISGPSVETLHSELKKRGYTVNPTLG